jgi:hypothetical protein
MHLTGTLPWGQRIGCLFFGSYKVNFNAMLLLSDGYLTGFDQAFVMKSHEDVNLNLDFGSLDDKWKIGAWARNIFEPLPTHQPEFFFGNNYQSTGVSQRQFMTYGLSFTYSH